MVGPVVLVGPLVIAQAALVREGASAAVQRETDQVNNGSFQDLDFIEASVHGCLIITRYCEMRFTPS